jgi:hypothetical protein
MMSDARRLAMWHQGYQWMRPLSVRFRYAVCFDCPSSLEICEHHLEFWTVSICYFFCLQEKKLEIYNAIVKLQKGDEDDEKLQVCIFVHLISFIESCCMPAA